MAPRMLVTGAAGMVGGYVSETFADTELILTDRAGQTRALDVRDAQAVRAALEAARPEVVLHLAAATDVDRCEQEPEWAHQVNVEGTRHVAAACKAQGSILVYLSTGAVFSGAKSAPYIEEDEPAPVNVYGRTKWAAERVITSSLERYYIIRAGWMLGGGPRDKKFVGRILRLLTDGRCSLPVVNDTWGSPTYAKDLLNGIRRVLETRRYGLYHLVNPGCCSRYDVALAVQEALSRCEVQLTPVSSAAFALPAPRPRMEALQNARLERMGLSLMRPWRDALREYLRAEMLIDSGTRA